MTKPISASSDAELLCALSPMVTMCSQILSEHYSSRMPDLPALAELMQEGS